MSILGRLYVFAVRMVLSLMPAFWRDWLMREAAMSLGVHSLAFVSDIGSFEGDPGDHVVHSNIVVTGTWETHVQNFMKEFFANGGTLVDVGANIGAISIPAAHYGATVHAIEPDTRNLRFLRANVARNMMMGRVFVHAFAAWEKPDFLNMERHAFTGGGNRVLETGAYTVQGAPVDALIPLAPRRPLLVKIDIQGAEVRAFKGMRRLLQQADAVVCEVEPSSLKLLGNTLDELLESLSVFPLASVNGAKAEPFEVVAEQLRRRVWHNSHVDLVVMRAES